jgi:conjugative transposon TraN protein
MKLLFLLGAMLCISPFLFAQNTGNNLNALPIIHISRDVDIHILSPEPIQYADISTHSIVGDLPVKNMLRVKILPDSIKRFMADDTPCGVITIVGESFIAQYRLLYSAIVDTGLRTEINIVPAETRPLDFPGITMTQAEMKAHALAILDKKPGKPKRKFKAYSLQVQLNHIYTVGDEIFLDIAYTNNTNLPYDPDEIRFKIEDKKINKATNVQSVEIKPEWSLYPLKSFARQYHNIYVLKKMTFPDNKVLNVQLSEKQVSGRTITLQVKYGDILKADTF